MAYTMFGKLTEFGRDDIREFVSTIHRRVYGYESDDLLERVLGGLPE